MHIHILGICGTFMGGLAALAHEAGHRVTGCDAHVYPPMSDQLRSLGIELIEGWSPDQLQLAPDMFVVGNVVTRGNALFEALLDAGSRYTSGPQWLADHVLQGRHVLAVAGTHGKTSTTAMLAWILDRAALDPGFLVGGVPVNFGISARLGGGRYFVIEADEYDTALFDKRSKFVHYRPRTAILNNLELDHADIFADLAAIETQFHHLVRTIPATGRVIANGREDSLKRVIERGCWSELEWFNDPVQWTVDTGTSEAEAVFALRRVELGRAQMPLAGSHNRENVLAAIAAARHVGVTPAQAIGSLSRFEGIKRRMELRGTEKGVRVYDDFAHHPTAIALTVAGLRRREPQGRILAVLEPRSNTMKLGVMKAQLPASLAEADVVFCYANALDWDVAAALSPLGDRARTYVLLEQLVEEVAAAAQPGDHVLVMSNGGFGGVHQKLLDALAAAR